MEDAGIPTVVLTTTAFRHLTEQVARALRLPDARMVVIEHPLGGIDDAAVIERAQSIVEEVLRLWTGG